MNHLCQNSECLSQPNGTKIVRDGTFLRPSDGRKIQRYRCQRCRKRFSSATFEPAYRQNKRRLNYKLKMLLCSGVSLRRSALILNTTRKTVARKLIFLGKRAKVENKIFLQKISKVEEFQFDDLQTIEHSKCKPLSVTLAVDRRKRTILGAEVSVMPATGHLAKLSRKKYGYRPDNRLGGIERLFKNIKICIKKNAIIHSDQHPYYPPKVRSFFPHANYKRFKGVRGSLGGQGELKKIKYDPLFTLNHTCAMFRANINRLIRKTWCTTKKAARLKDHLEIYINFHNTYLLA